MPRKVGSGAGGAFPSERCLDLCAPGPSTFGSEWPGCVCECVTVTGVSGASSLQSGRAPAKSTPLGLCRACSSCESVRFVLLNVPADFLRIDCLAFQLLGELIAPPPPGPLSIVPASAERALCVRCSEAWRGAGTGAAKRERERVSLLEGTQAFIFLWTPCLPSLHALHTASSGTGQELGFRGESRLGGKEPLHPYICLHRSRSLGERWEGAFGLLIRVISLDSPSSQAGVPACTPLATHLCRLRGALPHSSHTMAPGL